LDKELRDTHISYIGGGGEKIRGLEEWRGLSTHGVTHKVKEGGAWGVEEQRDRVVRFGISVMRYHLYTERQSI
jgi:hypothetical protein